MLRLQILILCLLILSGCSLSSTKIEPHLVFKPTANDIARLPTAFPPVKFEEQGEDWAKELSIGIRFAKTFDFYRAITAFKRALFLLPEGKTDYRHRIEFAIIESYYFAGKYCEAIQEFESGGLQGIQPDFPPFRDLLIILHDCYDKIKEYGKSEAILKLLQKGDCETVNDLQLSIALVEGDLSTGIALAQESCKTAPVLEFIAEYHHMALSPRKAQILNAILPGAGYYYVGQTRAASTSLILNSLFIAAAWYFFDSGNWPAGLITLSLETGWYVGGINGAGIEAKEYNEQLYKTLGRGMMIRNDLFPVLMLETAF